MHTAPKYNRKKMKEEKKELTKSIAFITIATIETQTAQKKEKKTRKIKPNKRYTQKKRIKISKEKKLHAKTNRLPEKKKEQENRDQDGKKCYKRR